MLNKTDIKQSGDSQKKAALISPAKVVESRGDNFNYPTAWHHRVKYLQQFKLSTKSIILSIAIGTLPVLGIGAIAYIFGSNLITKQIITSQETKAISLSDTVNNFIGQRYGDIQVLSNLSFLSQTSGGKKAEPENSSKKRKVNVSKINIETQAALDRLIKTGKVYDSVAVFDLNGQVIIQSKGESLSPEKQLTYFQKVIQKNIPIISQPEMVKNIGTVIYIAAPIKDISQGNTIGIVRTRMPLKALGEVVKGYIDDPNDPNQYYFLDETGKILISSHQELVSQEAIGIYPNLANVLSAKDIDTFTTITKNEKKQQLISYVPFRKLSSLPDINWQLIIAKDTAIAFKPQREFLTLIASTTPLIALLMTLFVAWLSQRIHAKIVNINTSIAEAKGSQEQIYLSAANKKEHQDIEIEWLQLLIDITKKIRLNLQPEYIYQTAISEVSQVLKTDRIIIYKRHRKTQTGKIIAESVTGDWQKILKVYNNNSHWQELIQNGGLEAISNIEESPNLAPSYIEWLKQFSVQSSLTVPIFTHGEIQGFLITHHCRNSHIWQPREINLLTQVAAQIGYAIEQSHLVIE
ncbi:MAG: GAF domain-containing protein, partial [Dolichospermum sp.]|nr:GAF domain-containing protein [Dolichospermum sp.]